MTIIQWHKRPVSTGMMDEMFNRNFQSGFEKNCGCIPATNILEKEDSFEIQLAVPGMNKEDFSLNMEENLLTVGFEKKEDEQEGEYIRHEYDMEGFTRSFAIPKTADVENINARYEDGILYISVPKQEKARLSKQIQVD
ncbi:MAG: Hsp20/alpha crystallin family protein [Bacteroidales bacterium]